MSGESGRGYQPPGSGGELSRLVKELRPQPDEEKPPSVSPTEQPPGEQASSQEGKKRALHSLRQPGANIERVIAIVGRQETADELHELCSKDMADLALVYGVAMKERSVVKDAVAIINNSGAYSDEDHKLAEYWAKNLHSL